jgi:GAF domain-containing protein
VKPWFWGVGVPGTPAAAAYVLQGAFGEQWPNWLRWSLLGVGAVLTLTALALTARVASQESGARQAAERVGQKVAQALAKYQTEVNDGWGSFVALLDDVVNAPSAARRRELQNAMIMATISLAAGIGTERPRACYFKSEGVHPNRRLVLVHFIGRDDQPRPEFAEGTAEGSFAYDVLEGPKGTRLWADTVQVPPPGSTQGRTYKTFIAAKVEGGGTLFGMLGVDSPEPKSFTAQDETLAGIIAHMLGIALAAGRRGGPHAS